MSVTEWAAWIGAATGPTALFWEIYKWKKSGLNLKVRCNKLLVLAMGNPPGSLPSVIEITIEVLNRGDKRTTITELEEKYFRGWLFRLLRKESWSFHPSPVETNSDNRLPFVLEPGEIWIGFVRHQKDSNNIVESVESGLFFVYVHHTFSSKVPRIRITKEKLSTLSITSEFSRR